MAIQFASEKLSYALMELMSRETRLEIVSLILALPLPGLRHNYNVKNAAANGGSCILW